MRSMLAILLLATAAVAQPEPLLLDTVTGLTSNFLGGGLLGGGGGRAGLLEGLLSGNGLVGSLVSGLLGPLLGIVGGGGGGLLGGLLGGAGGLLGGGVASAVGQVGDLVTCILSQVLGQVGGLLDQILGPALGALGLNPVVSFVDQLAKQISDGLVKDTQVYHPVTVRDIHLQFATITSVSLPSGSFLECAKAVASAGLEAFTFEGDCTGYRLRAHFLTRQTGDVAVYVRADYLDEEPVGAPMNEAPYKVIEDGVTNPYRVYMLSTFVETEDQPFFSKTEEFEAEMVNDRFNNFVFRENGDIMKTFSVFPDFNSCFNKGAYGLEIAVSTMSYDFASPIVYFFEECGNTVQVPNTSAFYKMLIFSHPGFGCKEYPSGLPDECTVTFEGEESLLMSSHFGFFFYDNDSDDGGLYMDITGSNTETGESETWNMYLLNYIATLPIKLTFEVSLKRQPSKRAIGFFIGLF